MTNEYSEPPHAQDAQTLVGTQPSSQEVPETVGLLQGMDVTPEQIIPAVTTQCEWFHLIDCFSINCYFVTLLNLVIILFHMTGTGAVRYNKLPLKIKSRNKILPFRDDMTIRSFLLLVREECGPGVTCLVLNDGKVLLNLKIHVFNYLIYAIHHMLLYYTSSLSQL